MYSIDIMYILCYFGTMRTIRVSATEARNNFFNLLNQVIYEGVQVIIQKAGVAKKVILMPKTEKEEEHEKTMKILKKTFGIWKNVPDSRIYDDRLRGKRAREYLDRVRKWDV